MTKKRHAEGATPEAAISGKTARTKASPVSRSLQAIKKWQNNCPLRVLRKSHKITLTQASATIGVSVTSLQFWESGTRQPKPENFKSLLHGYRISESTWRKWLSSKPR